MLKWAMQDSNTPLLEQSKKPISASGGAEFGAPNAPTSIQDPDLLLVVERWPNLPENIKATIKTLIETTSRKEAI